MESNPLPIWGKIGTCPIWGVRSRREEDQVLICCVAPCLLLNKNFHLLNLHTSSLVSSGYLSFDSESCDLPVEWPAQDPHTTQVGKVSFAFTWPNIMISHLSPQMSYCRCEYLGSTSMILVPGNIGGTLRDREGLGREWFAPAYSDSFMVSVCYRLGFGFREHPLVVVSRNKELGIGHMDSGKSRQFYRKEKGTQRM